MANRMSLLGISEYCGLVGKLNAAHGSGRRAAMGKYYHAKISGTASLPALSIEEKAEVDAWALPPPAMTKCEYETAVAITENGTAITEGHVDQWWFDEGNVLDGSTVYVRDFKTGNPMFYSPYDLQLMAYGLALADLTKADRFVTGIFYAQTGDNAWAEPVKRAEFADLYQRIKIAALNVSDTGTTGPHCSRCFQRTHCPEYLLPGVVSQLDGLKPVTDGVIDNDTAYKALQTAQALSAIADAAIDTLKSYAAKEGGITAPDGSKRWLGSPTAGRESSLSPKELREILGRDAEKYIKQGKPSVRYAWKKS